MQLSKFAANWYIPFVTLCMNIMHSKTVKFINAITSHDARENDATQTSEVSKYQIISQYKLDKFQLQCYSKCSK